MSSVSAGVWLQSPPHNSSSLGKNHLLRWSCWQTEEPDGFLSDTRTQLGRRRTYGSDSYHRNRPPFSLELKLNQSRPLNSVVKELKALALRVEKTVN